MTTAYEGDALDIYSTLPAGAYTLILSDGAYGMAGFPGDPSTPRALPEWYAPHLAAWGRLAAPSASLLFWGTPRSCAAMVDRIEAAGWAWRSRIVWDKGMAALAGRLDTNAARTWPIASEECHHFARESVDISALAAQHVTAEATGDGLTHGSVWEAAGADPRNTVRAFICDEWRGRAGLTNAAANEACGVADMASRHYFSRSQWLLPTWEHFQSLARYATAHAPLPDGARPYLITPAVWAAGGTLADSYAALRDAFDALRSEYEALRYPFRLPVGVSDVWRDNPVTRKGRHGCEKRMDHTIRLVRAHTRAGDRVLEPFGGSATVLRACLALGDRDCDTIERDPVWAAKARALLSGGADAARLTATETQPSLFGPAGDSA